MLAGNLNIYIEMISSHFEYFELAVQNPHMRMLLEYIFTVRDLWTANAILVKTGRRTHSRSSRQPLGYP